MNRRFYTSYENKVGRGTMFSAIREMASFLRWSKSLYASRWMFWIIMLSLPFPYIANTAGWMTAELGRQPWLVYGLLRTQNGMSSVVNSGSAVFTLIGFCGLYFVLGLLFVYLVGREIFHGPEAAHA